MNDFSPMVELEKAQKARTEGKEGMARVLARRSAGLAIRKFLARQDHYNSGLSLNDLIKDGEIRKMLPNAVHSTLDRLSTQVGEDYQLPEGMDLIADAQMIISQLSNINGENR